MKILLVLPAGERVRVTLEKPAVPRRAMLRFSVLSLTSVAALTPPEHTVEIVDENVTPLDYDSSADLVGITFMTALAPRAYEIAAEFRRRGKTVVAGGYHATLCPDDAQPHFDAIVVGDAEGAWPRLLADVQAHRLQPRYAAVPKPVLEVPAPRRELLRSSARHYVTVNAVQTTRGCRHACRYCSVTAFHHHQHRQRPVGDVMREIAALPRDFIFVDDNICADRAYALALFRAMAPMRRRWVSQCSIEVADDAELLGAMAAAGCCGLFIGIESASARNLAEMGKQFNATDRYAERMGRIRGAGIGIVAGIIVGMDQDTPETFARTLELLERLHIDTVQVNILTPLPGTPLFSDMEKAGRMVDRDWSHYDFRHVVFQPARMSAEELQAGADWLYAQFYRLDRILGRFVRALFTVGVVPAVLGLRLGLTYRYDNRREGIVGWIRKADRLAGVAEPPVRAAAAS